MPPERQPTQKRRQLPFKPPRMQSPAVAGPSSTGAFSKSKAATKPRKTNATASSSKATKPSKTARQKSPADTPDSGAGDSGSESRAASSSSPSASDNRERSASQEPDYILAEITHAEQTTDVALGEPTIPPKLLTKLLHHHFQNEKTKIAKDANEVVAKYVDVFVREALARAAYERSDGGGGLSVADGFLEVEDLEKMAPQLALDF
ncbi:CENP-S associating centromere protein X-domain-containing protein [Aspergillus ambiguus]|uniref:CENP-X/MHF2 family protein n=1 Tax=Aspergillus ambiguus TaxID=176160 RepID=UPI003CCCB88C